MTNFDGAGVFQYSSPKRQKPNQIKKKLKKYFSKVNQNLQP
jgi:hypothetical protein